MIHPVWRSVLLPLSALYGGILKVRNYLYDKNILRSAAFNFPVICVGNLAVGGTGKTPMTEYLVSILQPKFRIATLSRGYKRKTRGFDIATAGSSALDIGDEPMQIHRKFPEIAVAVSEERIVGIPKLLHERPETQVIILDDAFQHRPVRAGLNILLTDYNRLYTRSQLLPAGNLRDVRSSSTRAQVIVVTKCRDTLQVAEKESILREISPQKHQRVYFTSINYGKPYHIFSQQTKEIDKSCHVLLVCGIANPSALQNFLEETSAGVTMLHFKDHHIFTSTDLKNILAAYEQLPKTNRMILTTEKDAVRLTKFQTQIEDAPVFVIPMQHRFLFNEAPEFEKQVTSFVQSFH